jgi:hypothetical protein
MIECGQSRPEVAPVGLFAWLFAKPDGRQASRPGRAPAGRPATGKRAQPKPAQDAGKAPALAGNGVYSVERSVTTLIRSGLKRRKTTRTTKEWRHGNCQVRHRSKAAAIRCGNR